MKISIKPSVQRFCSDIKSQKCALTIAHSPNCTNTTANTNIVAIYLLLLYDCYPPKSNDMAHATHKAAVMSEPMNEFAIFVAKIYWKVHLMSYFTCRMPDNVAGSRVSTNEQAFTPLLYHGYIVETKVTILLLVSFLLLPAYVYCL